ncbi:hypothetical protein [Micromonospora sp. NPDC048830]|uniref:hypothetical protein n=1 Tax=Micromonospora sp. NPDC048830 TaxID=3364257 RepID=UPI003715DB36
MAGVLGCGKDIGLINLTGNEVRRLINILTVRPVSDLAHRLAAPAWACRWTQCPSITASVDTLPLPWAGPRDPPFRDKDRS